MEAGTDFEVAGRQVPRPPVMPTMAVAYPYWSGTFESADLGLLASAQQAGQSEIKHRML